MPKYKGQEKSYHKAYHAEWYRKNRTVVREKQAKRREAVRQWFREYKATLCCSKCPENHPAALDFHHRDKTTKSNTINFLYCAAYSKERLLEEMAKCDVLCSNCHRKLHWNEQ